MNFITAIPLPISFFALLLLEVGTGAMPSLNEPGVKTVVDYGVLGLLAFYMVWRYEKLAARLNKEAEDSERKREDRTAIRESELIKAIASSAVINGRMVEALDNMVSRKIRIYEHEDQAQQRKQLSWQESQDPR